MKLKSEWNQRASEFKEIVKSKNVGKELVNSKR